MPVQATWDNPEKTIILLKFEGNWTWEETYEAVEQRNQLINAVTNNVDIIVHFGDAGFKIPPNAITHSRNIMRLAHERLFRNVIVGFNPVHIVLWKVIEKVYTTMGKNQQYFLVSSLEEARAMLTAVPERESE